VLYLNKAQNFYVKKTIYKEEVEGIDPHATLNTLFMPTLCSWIDPDLDWLILPPPPPLAVDPNVPVKSN
jgi:hypothetical protein